MGQKTHPFGFRLGVTEAHRSRWYAPKALYGELLVEDQKIRTFLDKRLNRRPPTRCLISTWRTREEFEGHHQRPARGWSSAPRVPRLT